MGGVVMGQRCVKRMERALCEPSTTKQEAAAKPQLVQTFLERQDMAGDLHGRLNRDAAIHIAVHAQGGNALRIRSGLRNYDVKKETQNTTVKWEHGMQRERAYFNVEVYAFYRSVEFEGVEESEGEAGLCNRNSFFSQYDKFVERRKGDTEYQKWNTIMLASALSHYKEDAVHLCEPETLDILDRAEAFLFMGAHKTVFVPSSSALARSRTLLLLIPLNAPLCLLNLQVRPVPRAVRAPPVL